VLCCAASCGRRQQEALAVAVVEEDKLGQDVQRSAPSKASTGGGQAPSNFAGGGSTESMGKEFSTNSRMATARELADAGSISMSTCNLNSPKLHICGSVTWSWPAADAYKHLCVCGSSYFLACMMQHGRKHSARLPEG
jgi:hypothetical protein